MDEIIKYKTGAIVTRDGYEKFVSFPDCLECEGIGYKIESAIRYSYRTRKEQCLKCALRHGSAEFYNPQEAYKTIAQQVNKTIKLPGGTGVAYGKNKGKGTITNRHKLTPDQIKEIEDFQDSELARQYRQLLRNVWAWQEPERIPA